MNSRMLTLGLVLMALGFALILAGKGIHMIDTYCVARDKAAIQ